MATAEEVDAFLPGSMARSRGYHGVPLPHGRRLPGMDLTPIADIVFRDGVVDKSVIDVGCHHGFFLYDAVRRGAARAVGVEPDEGRRRVAQEVSRLHGGSYEVVGGHTRDLPEGTFDLVLLLSVIHHIPNPVADVANLARVAKERVVIEVPEPADPALLHRLVGTPGGRTQAQRLKDYPRRALLRWQVRHVERRVPLAVVTDFRGLYLSRDAFRNLFMVQNRIFSAVEFVPSPLRRDRSIAFCTPL